MTMTQQLPDGILLVEVFGVSKIRTLAARDGPGGSPLRVGGGGGGWLILWRFLTSFFMSLVVVVVGLSTTAGTGDSNGGETHTHWLIMLKIRERAIPMRAWMWN